MGNGATNHLQVLAAFDAKPWASLTPEQKEAWLTAREIEFEAHRQAWAEGPEAEAKYVADRDRKMRTEIAADREEKEYIAQRERDKEEKG